MSSHDISTIHRNPETDEVWAECVCGAVQNGRTKLGDRQAIQAMINWMREHRAAMRGLPHREPAST